MHCWVHGFGRDVQGYDLFAMLKSLKDVQKVRIGLQIQQKELLLRGANPTGEGDIMYKRFCSRGAWRNAIGTTLLLLSTTGFAASSELMLSYELTHDMLSTPDNFSVSVYDDGVALVHYPGYMKKAGDYMVELTPSEVQQIRLLTEHPLVQEFNPGQANSQKADIDAQSQELFAISDDSWSNFEVHTPGHQKSIRWANVSIDAERYPQIGIFRKLAEIEAALLQLDQHPTATPVAD